MKDNYLGRNILDTDFPEYGLDLNEEIARIEKDLIQMALKRTHGSKSKAAKLLGLDRHTLDKKLKKRRQ